MSEWYTYSESSIWTKLVHYHVLSRCFLMPAVNRKHGVRSPMHRQGNGMVYEQEGCGGGNKTTTQMSNM